MEKGYRAALHCTVNDAHSPFPMYNYEMHLICVFAVRARSRERERDGKQKYYLLLASHVLVRHSVLRV